MSKIELHRNKSLRLDNVMIKEVVNTIDDIGTVGINLEDSSLESIVVQMENQIKNKGASTVGPLIQYSGVRIEQEQVGVTLSFMLQASNYIHNLDPGYKIYDSKS